MYNMIYWFLSGKDAVNNPEGLCRQAGFRRFAARFRAGTLLI